MILLNRPSAAAMRSYVKLNYFDHLFTFMVPKLKCLVSLEGKCVI